MSGKKEAGKGPAKPSQAGRLAVLLDGDELPEEEARAFWGRFSAWMDANKGDLGGFAKSEGLASVHPTMQANRAVLVASRSAAQRAYTNAPTVKTSLKAPGSGGGGSGGSSGHHTKGSGANKSDTGGGKTSKN